MLRSNFKLDRLHTSHCLDQACISSLLPVCTTGFWTAGKVRRGAASVDWLVVLPLDVRRWIEAVLGDQQATVHNGKHEPITDGAVPVTTEADQEPNADDTPHDDGRAPHHDDGGFRLLC